MLGNWDLHECRVVVWGPPLLRARIDVSGYRGLDVTIWAIQPSTTLGGQDVGGSRELAQSVDALIAMRDVEIVSNWRLKKGFALAHDGTALGSSVLVDVHDLGLQTSEKVLVAEELGAVREFPESRCHVKALHLEQFDVGSELPPAGFSARLSQASLRCATIYDLVSTK